ncbi:hypothetical protein BOSP111201_13715 [Bordetella sputigena]|uniref:hypothetical protein n=1 Tax=Bordetella sputigena TaxID=1416810 RepID=UPI0039EF99D0
MSVFVIAPNVHGVARMFFDGTSPARGSAGDAMEAADANSVARTMARVAARHSETPHMQTHSVDVPDADIPELGIADIMTWGLLLARMDTSSATQAQSNPEGTIDRTSRRWMTLKVGEAVARSLDVPSHDHTPEELAALGEQALIEGLASGTGLDVSLLVVAAHAAGFIEDADLANTDPEKLADRLHAFIRAEFAQEIAFYEALGKLAALEVPTRMGTAHALLKAAGLNPDHPRIEHIHFPGLAIVPTPALTNDEPSTPTLRYFHADTLADTNPARLLTDANTRPTPEQMREIAGRLPASLDAEFNKRFDDYQRDAATQMAILTRCRLLLHARENGIDLSSAAVSVARPVLESALPGVLPMRGGVVQYVRKPTTTIQAQGFIYTVRPDAMGATPRRFFVSSQSSLARELPAGISIDAWVDANRGLVFGEDALARVFQPPYRSGVAIREMAEGKASSLELTLAAWFRTEIETLRPAARGKNSHDQMMEFLRSLIPSRPTIDAARRGDVEAAIVTSGLEVLSLISTLWLGAGLAGLGVKLGRQGLLTLATALKSPQLAMTVTMLGSRMAGRAGLHGLTRSAPLLQALRQKAARGIVKGWARILSLDPERLAARMYASHPGMASSLHTASHKLRGPMIADGQWRLPGPRTRPATGPVDDAIEAIPSVIARDEAGGALRLQQLGRARAYTQYDPANGRRIGAVLLAGPGDLLYRSLPVHILRRYRVGTPDVVSQLQGQRAGANGAIVLQGRTYARIGDDYIEVVADLATSTDSRPIWHAVPPETVSPDVIVHRLAYDPDTALWRHASIPVLEGGGRVTRIIRGGSTASSAASSSGVSSGGRSSSARSSFDTSSIPGSAAASVSSAASSATASPVPPSPFSPSAGIPPGRLHLRLEPFTHAIRARYPNLLGHARKNYFVRGPDGQVRRLPSGYSGGTVTPELLDGELVRSLSRIPDYSHAGALDEILAGYRYDAATGAVSYTVGERAVSSYDAGRAIYALREGPQSQYMIPATDHLGDAEACGQMLLAEGKTPAQVLEQLDSYQRLRANPPRTGDPAHDTMLLLSAQLKSAAVTTYTNGATHKETLPMLQRALEEGGPVILLRKGAAVILDAIDVGAEGAWLTIRHPVTASQVRIRDHREFWMGDDLSGTVTPATPDLVLNDIRIMTIPRANRLPQSPGSTQ